jgi:RNA polymerase sigma-70 factor (ECF subfamily)
VDSEAVFEDLYRACGGRVRAFVHRRISGDDADDVVSEVFATAWRRLDEAPEDPLIWLFAIARGHIANRRRADRRRHALQTRLASTAATAIDPELEPRATDAEAVLRALASLSEGDQEVLRLLAWEGLDRSRAAQVLGMSPGRFSVRLHRARRRLAHALQRDRVSASPARSSPSMEVPHER